MGSSSPLTADSLGRRIMVSQERIDMAAEMLGALIEGDYGRLRELQLEFRKLVESEDCGKCYNSEKNKEEPWEQR